MVGRRVWEQICRICSLPSWHRRTVFGCLKGESLMRFLMNRIWEHSGRVNPKTSARLGKITGAKYLVAATLSAFEHNTSGGGGGISFGGISLGGKQEKAYMAVDLKVIDVETGEIYDARTVEATSKSSGISVGVSPWRLRRSPWPVSEYTCRKSNQGLYHGNSRVSGVFYGGGKGQSAAWTSIRQRKVPEERRPKVQFNLIN